MIIKSLFLASSSELLPDRREFELFIGRRNKDLVRRNIYIELIIWEDFLDFVSQTRLQDEYNKALLACDIFVMLYWRKVGPYTMEEFETAYRHFKLSNKPLLFTYFKDVEFSFSSVSRTDFMSVLEF